MGRLFHSLAVTAALLSSLQSVNAQVDPIVGETSGLEWDSSEFVSPDVFPSPPTSGNGGWEEAFQKASDFVSQLTLEEKAFLVTGRPGPCVGNIDPIPRLNFSGMCLQDGPLAIRQATYATVFPAGITVAASWDRRLTRTRALALGKEFRNKGAHVYLGPVAGPLGRSAYGGRNWEGFSPDSYLTGLLFADTIEGVQEMGVQTSAKHFIGNEQETMRWPKTLEDGSVVEAVSAEIDDRTMHEAYLWPFQNGVKAGTTSVMCSYQRLNGTYACQNSKALNGLLKGELGFSGYVVSDWQATHSTGPAINAGEDVDMPGTVWFAGPFDSSFFGANITVNIENGTIAEERLDDQARRLLTPYFHLKQDENYPLIDGSVVTMPTLQMNNESLYTAEWTFGPANVDVREDHAKLVRELGAAGIVLLKNLNNTLPLKNPKNIGVFGNDGGDNYNGLYSADNPDVRDTGFVDGHLAVGGGSGTGRLTYSISPLDAITRRASEQDNNPVVEYVLNNTLILESNGYNLVKPAPDVCLVFLKTWATESYDRSSLLPDWDGAEVVETIAANCSNTVVVTHSGGLNVLPFADHPNVTAILAAHFGGQEAGNSIVDILWGDVNPSGKLPYTIAKQASDYDFAPVANSSELINATEPDAWVSPFEERLLIDYKWFDYNNISVAFPFGFGLSYTNFSLSDSISVSPVSENASVSALPTQLPIQPGGNPALFEVLYTVNVTVANTGDVAGQTVPQLYLSLPGPPGDEDATPLRQLRGFDKISLEAGESKEVGFELQRRDISSWDVVAQDWRIAEGEIGVFVGFSSRDEFVETSFSPLS